MQAQIADDLKEQAGKSALLDLILDHQLELELRKLNLQITPEDLDLEESSFVRTIADQSRQTQGYQLLNSFRSAKGLGPNRYPRLLRRNAILRKLTKDTAEPTPSEMHLSEAIAFGTKHRVRMFVTQSHANALALRDRVINAPLETQRWVFADACSTSSIHPSAPRGGLITSLSIHDPSYPLVLSEAIEKLHAGELSKTLATDSGHTLIYLESFTPAIHPTNEQLRFVHDQLRLRKQSTAMRKLAAELIEQADVIVMDQGLNWSWKNAS